MWIKYVGLVILSCLSFTAYQPYVDYLKLNIFLGSGLRRSQKEIQGKIKSILNMTKWLFSIELFEEIGVNVNREKRCWMLRKLSVDINANKLTPISNIHKEKCKVWLKKVKTKFSVVIFVMNFDKYIDCTGWLGKLFNSLWNSQPTHLTSKLFIHLK